MPLEKHSAYSAGADIQTRLATLNTPTPGKSTIDIDNPENTVGAYIRAAPQRVASAKANAFGKVKSLVSKGTAVIGFPVRKVIAAANAVDAAGARWLSEGKAAVCQPSEGFSDESWVDLNHTDIEQGLLACCESKFPEAGNGSNAVWHEEDEMVEAPVISVANMDPRLKMDPVRAGRVDW